MPIVMVRVDDRYIHGQVATAWTRYVGANHIYVVNDGVAGNKMTRMVLEMAKPGSCDLTILDLEEGTRRLVEGADDDKNIMVLYGNPEDVLWSMDQGLEFGRLVIGFMRHEPGKKAVKRGGQVYVDEKDKEVLRKINDRGVKIEVQKVPTERSHDVIKLIEGMR